MGSNEINDKIDEYHLMIEEVLGGMDIMISRLDARITSLENAIESIPSNSSMLADNELTQLRKDVNLLKDEVKEGFKLAFRQINEK